MAATSLAQQNLSINERVFLTSTHSEAGIINMIEMFENNQDAADLRKFGDWTQLIGGLNYPTYTTYDFKAKLFYVCDCDRILQYEIVFNDESQPKVSATLNGPVVQNVFCGGLALDKFHNLFYVDVSDKSSVRKVNRDLLLLDKYPVDLVSDPLYEGEFSRAAINMASISIEHEYLYWTNDSHMDGHGGVHKAFTEPFIRNEPFQTYEIKDVSKASTITTNENYLFFTGQMSTRRGQP